MQQYRLYFLKDGMLIGEASIEAADHDEAARLARLCGHGQAVEVWSAQQRVRIVAPARQPRPEEVAED